MAGSATPMHMLMPPALALAGLEAWEPHGSPQAGGGAAAQRGSFSHHRTPSMELGQLMRGGTAALNQVMEEWETRSALYRLVSDGRNLPSPQHPHAAAVAGLLRPDAPTVLGGPPPPSGEVHMDEIDLLERVGKGGYG